VPGSASGFKLKGLFVTVEREIDYEVGQDDVDFMGLDIHIPVFFISGGIVVLFVSFAATLQAPVADFFGWLRPTVTGPFDWLFAVTADMGIGVTFYGVSEPVSHFPASLSSHAGTSEGWAPLGGAAGIPFAIVLLGVCPVLWRGLAPERNRLQTA